MNLRMALRAIAEKRLLLANIRSHVHQTAKRMSARGRSDTVSRVASQTEKRCWLVQQIVCHAAVRRMTNRAVLSRRRVLVCKGALLFGMTLVANLVDGCFFQVSLCLAVTIVAIRANHLAFFDRMV